jgi:hypothetical protein
MNKHRISTENKNENGSKNKSRSTQTSKIALRPKIQDYGISKHEKGLLEWSFVTERLNAAHNYWICTTTAGGQPHAVPVWGVAIADICYFSSGRRSKKGRNLSRNSAVTMHLESGDETVIIEGIAKEVTDQLVLKQIIEHYNKKYGISIPEKQTENPIWGIYPRKVFAWREKDFPTSATCWIFD